MRLVLYVGLVFLLGVKAEQNATLPSILLPPGSVQENTTTKEYPPLVNLPRSDDQSFNGCPSLDAECKHKLNCTGDGWVIVADQLYRPNPCTAREDHVCCARDNRYKRDGYGSGGYGVHSSYGSGGYGSGGYGGYGGYGNGGGYGNSYGYGKGHGYGGYGGPGYGYGGGYGRGHGYKGGYGGYGYGGNGYGIGYGGYGHGGGYVGPYRFGYGGYGHHGYGGPYGGYGGYFGSPGLYGHYGGFGYPHGGYFGAQPYGGYPGILNAGRFRNRDYYYDDDDDDYRRKRKKSRTVDDDDEDDDDDDGSDDTTDASPRSGSNGSGSGSATNAILVPISNLPQTLTQPQTAGLTFIPQQPIQQQSQGAVGFLPRQVDPNLQGQGQFYSGGAASLQSGAGWGHQKKR